VQALIWDISSPILSELGLEAAVQWLADKLSRSHGLAVRFRDDGTHKPVADDVRLVVFQAARELLINVAKHAGVDRAQISIRRVGEALEIEVADDGAGFDPTDVGTARSSHGGFGLFSIRERLSYLGGRL
jgi:signal transduction histidine kinase